MPRFSSSLIIFIIYIIAVSLFSGRKKKNTSSSGSGASAANRQTAVRADRPTPTIPSLANRHSKKDDDCDYGEVNHRYSHQNEKRVAQLKGYLDAGLIDKKESNEMLERYTRQDRLYDSYMN